MIDVPRETQAQIDVFIAALLIENERHNLIARSTVDSVGDRHVQDSLQLLALAPEGGGRWIDIGTGAGFPGMIVAIAAPRWHVVMVEPRGLRAQFLQRMIDQLGIADRAEVVAHKIEHVQGTADVISARAVARLDRLFSMAAHLARPQTRWLLHNGQQAAAEVAEARQAWNGTIRLVPSVTSTEAAIVVADQIRPKERRR